jgi:hypothetical protein
MPNDPRDPLPPEHDLIMNAYAHAPVIDAMNALKDDPSLVLRVQESLEAMIALYGGERVAKWVRDLTFLIERKELP